MASYLETAMEIAHEAGMLLEQFQRARVPFELKGEFDLVTEADRASERLVVERLKSHFPTHGVEGEEGARINSTSPYLWFVDPLDGTTNFAHGFPVYNVTLALAHEGELIAGVIYDPVHNEMFAAEKGSGATLNGEKISVSRASKLDHSLVATGFPSRKRHLNINIHFYWQMAMLTHGVRRAGSAAIDLAWVACGRLDAFWEFGLNPWDQAAGMLLVQEAGGCYSDMKGGKASVRTPHLLADNGSLHDEILEVFSEIFRGEFRTPMPSIVA
ncbi:MAG TPA: inositol monophosphatase family protein [Bryobacteraceae bacterium]|nr:inositol monophosphatase family protein [Bryobacteraceae bacterium]